MLPPTHSVVITGATGMVGKGVLLECLDDARVARVLVVNRRPLGVTHPKLREVLLADLLDVRSIADELRGYDACFFCMGVSAVGLAEAEYTRLTFDIVRAWADTLHELQPSSVFNYVSGTGTDETERGRVMWARIKGRTENYVLGRGFGDAYAFRPGFILPERDIRSATGWYNAIYAVLRPIFPLLRGLESITSTSRLGQAMIATLHRTDVQKRFENRDINRLARA